MFADLRDQVTVRRGDELVRHLKEFPLELKISAGVWFFSPSQIRFHEAYMEPYSIEERLDIAGEMAEYGLCGIEAHYPNEINEDNAHLYQQLEKDTGVRLITVIPNLFWDAQFEFGSLSSPVPEARRAAIDRVIETLRMNRELDTDFMVVWPGGDGYELNFGTDFYAMWDLFEAGLAEALDAVPGIRTAIEPKPYEPRGNNIYRNTTDGILMAQNVDERLRAPENRALIDEGHAIVGLNPELGHVLMGFEDFPYALSRILRQGRLAHTHWNSQPLGNYDQDLQVGIVSPEQIFAGMYALKMYGYRGYMGIDIFPERIPIRQALINSIDRMKAIAEMTEGVDHELVVACMERPDLNRGVIEAHLTRLFHPSSTGLSAMPAYRKGQG
ncbi:MAG: TIM barrel protein [Gemmatimonadetes bacterium]|nr:TIM barrel protein [Gemmatimonadota bacterium]MYH19474.1 TIM barrel protein [Gemmatimonadota bacterium]MYK99953.1 TIM barrel protein [Gemmatimonadota bacterium]